MPDCCDAHGKCMYCIDKNKCAWITLNYQRENVPMCHDCQKLYAYNEGVDSYVEDSDYGIDEGDDDGDGE